MMKEVHVPGDPKLRPLRQLVSAQNVLEQADWLAPWSRGSGSKG